jgi:pimeloyl-ACP methyl ester carboxylesterase
MSTFRESSVAVAPTGRKLAFSEVGERNSSRVLLCLPGLLETRATFDPLLEAVGDAEGLRVISLDYCGRGGSDPLPADGGYHMSVYLSDVETLIRQEIFDHGLPRPRLDILGTSMGGILGMYLASNADNDVQGLLLNDIGLNLTWMSIYGLYEGMKTAGRMPETGHLATRLGVTEGAVRDVQSPHHFDLPHHKDWKGMKFGHILHNFKGSVCLVYGSESGVCLPQQVQELHDKFPKLAAMQVQGATHPVPFSESVCKFVVQSLKLAPVPSRTKLPEAMPVKDSFVQAPLTLELSATTTPLEEAVVPVTSVEKIQIVVDHKVESVHSAEVENKSNWRIKFAKWLARFK